MSKLSRVSDQDCEDIELFASSGQIDSSSLRKHAEEALGGYVGNLKSVRSSLDIGCRVVDSARQTPLNHNLHNYFGRIVIWRIFSVSLHIKY